MKNKKFIKKLLKIIRKKEPDINEIMDVLLKRANAKDIREKITSLYYCNHCFLLFNKRYNLIPLDKIKETYKCPNCGETFRIIFAKGRESIIKVVIDDGIEDPKWKKKEDSFEFDK